MNSIFFSMGLMYSVFVSAIYCQYYPHRNPVKRQPYEFKENQNPFQTAYQGDQGYNQRFTDYGSQRSKPLTQSRYSGNDNKNKGKGKTNQDKYEEGGEYDYESNLDYNDLNGNKDFDPFKFVSDGVSGFDFGGLGDSGDHFDYNIDFDAPE